MKQTLKIFCVIGSLLAWVHGLAQNFTNKGREFWVGYGHHQFMETGTNTQEMILYLSAEEPATVTVTIDSTTWTRTYIIPANTVIASDLIPKAGSIDARLFSLPVSFGGNGGEGLFRFKGIHIVSDVPIVAYAHIYGSASSGASMLIPIETWGYSYTSLNSSQQYASNCYSWFYVIANHDSTMVEITPTVPSVLGKPANVPFQALLMKGQIYQYTAAIQSGSTGYNASGSKIRSVANASGKCYPIAVFSGSSRTSNPASCGSGGGDNDNQQSFPHQAWGKRYLTAPTSISSNASQFQTNNFRVLVKDPSTVVKRNGVILTGLTNNYYYFESSTADYLEADKPIMVGQFMTGGNCMGGGGNVGDPEMIYISPIEQAIKKIGFYRNTREAITVNYLTLIIPTAGVSSLTIDGSSSFSYTYAHPNLAGYTVVVKRWSSAQAQCLVKSDSAFTAITYGLGSVESYGYNAGTYIKNLNAVGAIHNVYDTASTSSFTCTNTPFEMSVLMAYKPTNMYWKLSTLSLVLSPNADVNVASPIPIDSPYVNGVKFYRYKLPGAYFFNDTGKFEVPILSTHPSIENCNNTEEVKFEVIVKGKPIADFSISHSGCMLDTAHFTGITSTSNNYTVAKWKWEFPGPAYDSGQNVARLFPPGIHNVKLTVISTEGCVGDTTKTITVQNKPTAGFIAPLSVCLGSSITVTDTALNAGINPVTNWYWNFGNGSIFNGATPSQTYTYPNYGTYTIKHVSSSSSTCVSDTVARIITVYAKPAPSFTFPSGGCIAPNGLVQFTNTTTVPDGQSISSWSWNFADPNANGSNPNTSNVQNPSHYYLSGTYNINLAATTANGCVKDTTITATFNLKPALAYPPLPSVCENISPLSVATATVTNSVSGSGVYSGPGTSSSGIFTPSFAGPGTHTIWYVFTSTANCKDSISQTITVYAAPKPNFTYPSGCLAANGLVQFTNTTTIADAQTLSYTWNFADPNANGTNPNTSTLQNPSHYYLSGTYNVNLSVTSSNGCVKDTTKSSTFNLRPTLAYPVLASICENIPSVSVATATVTNGVTGTGVYSGPGTSSSGVFTPSVAGPGIHTIKYVFTSTAGCADSISQTITVYAAPKPNFTYPSGCLAANGLVQFTNTTTIADAQTLTYTWNFADPNANGTNPNTSTLQNPSHYYLSGTYNVNLSVTSSNGCVKDTTKSSTFNLKPTLAYPALASICENIPSVSVATATVTNGVTGTGLYNGPGTSSTGVFTPSIAGAGIHIIKYVFTSAAGCSDSITQTIKVHPKPAALFTVNANICLDQSATIADQSTIVSGNITTWNWDFGDATNATYNNGNPFNKTYTNFNNYVIKLVAVSDSGCISDPSTKTIAVHAVPVANFNLPTGVCMPGGSAAFTNSSTAGDNSSLSYQWNFGDASPVNITTSPSHVYPSINTYSVRLTVTSAFGCVDDTVKLFNDFYDKPVALFTVSPDTLCQGADNIFTDQSMAPNSNVRSWSWNFDDGSSSSSQNPTKRFTNAGNYDVELTVTNTVGCISDPFTKTVVVYVQPVIDAGPSFVVPQGTVIKFNPKVNDSTSVSFLWSPPFGLSNPATLRPLLTAMQDQTYKLTATGAGNCTATDIITVKILKPVIIPNAFSPNGDGINDTWIIQNLEDYPGATVDIFNRYGQQVFHSNGYSTPWDGKAKGSPLPLATYYYVIELKNGFKPLTGSLTIVR